MCAAALGVVGLGLVGCSSSSPPTLRVTEVEVGERTSEGLVLYFNLDAANRNEVELPLEQVRYTLSLDGKEVFRGVRSPEASLRRLGTQPVRFPAVVPLGPGEPGPSGQTSFEIEGRLEYRSPGEISRLLYDNGIYRPTVSFRDAGRIDLGTP